MKQNNLRDKMYKLFNYSPMKMSWSLYLSYLNEAGKITGRSTLDILMVILETLEEMEKEEVKETIGMGPIKTPDDLLDEKPLV